jgi:hypothetical protein
MIYNFNKEAKIELLQKQIQESAIITALDHINASGSDLSVTFKAALSESDETLLTSIVNAHDASELFSQDPLAVLIQEDLTVPKDPDGASIHRVKAAKAGWKAQFHSMRITTAKTDGVVSKKRDGSNTGFCTIIMKDSQGNVTTTEEDCVETVVTWEPQYDMEIVGGQVFQKEPPTTDVWMWVTAAAHIPAEYGGSIAFTEGGINLQDVGIGGVADFDGRAAKYIAYDAVYHSGRFEICLKHDAGVKHSLTLTFELFKP